MRNIFTLSLLFISLIGNSQIVNIPDANFKAYLVGNSTINTNSNTEIEVSEAAAFNGSISCSGLNISDMTGIEMFTSLTYLNCYGNQLTSLDVTQNTALTDLTCSVNQLTSLDVSQNTSLLYLSCFENQLTSLDLNSALIELYCGNNQLTNFDLTQNAALIELDCYYNKLTSLDVTQNTSLLYLFCENNKLTSLDVTKNTALIVLVCPDNKIASLDVSQNTSLEVLYCSHNQLNCLNVKNGNNTNFTDFEAIGLITCIEVDDPTYSTTNWIDVSNSTSFSTNCYNTCLSTLDLEEDKISNVSINPNPANNQITINGNGLIEIIDATGKTVYQNTILNQSTIDVSNYNKGLYYVRIIDGDLIENHKLMIE